MITTDLLRDIKNQFLLDWNGIHGISHWARVFDIGIKLAVSTGANTSVVQLFFIFHDSGHQNYSALQIFVLFL